MRSHLVALLLLAIPCAALADPPDDGPARRRHAEPEEEEEDVGDELRDESPRPTTPPGFGKVRVELAGGGGARDGAPFGVAGGELRIGLVPPVALGLGGGALLARGEEPTWLATGTLRVQGDWAPAPFLEGGGALAGDGTRAILLGLGVAFAMSDRMAVSLGARGLLPAGGEGAPGALGTLALTWAP